MLAVFRISVVTLTLIMANLC